MKDNNESDLVVAMQDHATTMDLENMNSDSTHD
jgi:hypothetical protein